MQWLEYMGSDNHDIVLMGDTHAGSTMTHYAGIEETIDTIASERIIEAAFHMGDLVEAVTNDHPHWNQDIVDKSCPLPYNQYLKLAKMFEPAAIKFKGVHYGNHDRRLFSVGNFVRDTFCKELGVPYATFASHTTVRSKKDGKPMFRGYLAHGFGSVKSTADDPIRRETNMGLTLKRKLKDAFGDVAFGGMGHTHHGQVVAPKSKVYLTCTNGGIKDHETETPQTAKWIGKG
jgi:hypothetical protein